MSYCAAHDPILACGVLRCPRCGRTAWPADAEWLPGGLVLATWPPGCGHRGAVTFVVDPGALARFDDWCSALAVTTGDLCRNRAAPGSGYCRQHGRKQAA